VLFPRKFTDFARKKIFGRTRIEKSDRSCEFAPQCREFTPRDFPSNTHGCILRTQPPSKKVVVITGHECRWSLYERRDEWHGVCGA
jgi:hypothetical protein